MSLKNQKGIVRYQGRDDIVCSYGIRDDGKQFYYLDTNALKNGNRIATTALVEAVDPMVKASNIGLIDSEGKEIIEFNNRSIRPVNDDIILVEPATPVTQSVIDAIQLKSDPLSATKLVSTPALIKEKLNTKVGNDGRYLFNDQFSEATVCDINGNNLVNDERYSFIVTNGKSLFFSKNTADSDITDYSILPPEVQSDVTPANDTQTIDVSEVEVPKDVVENALSGVSMNEGSQIEEEVVETPAETEVDSSLVDEKVAVEAPAEDVVQETPIEEVSSEESASEVSVEETTSNDLSDTVQNTSMESGFEIPKVSIEIPKIPESVPPVSMNNETPSDAVSENVEDAVEDENTDESEKEEIIFDTIPGESAKEELVEEEAVIPEEKDEDTVLGEEEVFTTSVVPDKIENADMEESASDVDGIDITSKEAESEVEDDADETSVKVEETGEKEEENNTDKEVEMEKETIPVEVVSPEDVEEVVSPMTIVDQDEKIDFGIDEDMETDNMIDFTKDEDDSVVTDLDDEDMALFAEPKDETREMEMNHMDSFDDIDYKEPSVESNDDNIMADVAKTMTALMTRVKVVEAQLSEEKAKNAKLTSSGRNLVEKNRMLAKKIEVITNKNTSLEASVSKANSVNSVLENRVHEQKRVMDAQNRELQMLRPLLQDKEKVVGILADVQALLEEENSVKVR